MLRAALPASVILETDLASSGLILMANANRIQQVITNLVTNAGEASFETHCAVNLVLKSVSATEIPSANRFPVSFETQADAYACLEVTDRGSGITPHDIEKLFEPFFSTKFIGRGLGLSVVLGIARAHAGVVTVERSPGVGSVFRVFLPLSAAAIPSKPVHLIPELLT